MKISVIIPSYKPQEYLRECLDSLFCQTLPKDQFEVIVILNGCNEPYFSCIRNFISEHVKMNVRIYQTDVPGVSNARNEGIAHSFGEYIVFIDDDDIISPSYLEGLLKVSSPTCLGCSNTYAFEKEISEHQSNFVTPAFVECQGKRYSLFHYRKFLSAPWAKMIHKNMIRQSKFPTSLKKSEDSVFCLKLTPYIKEAKLTDADAIYYQRKRENSAMRIKRSVWDELREHLMIEWEYFKVWMSNPFKYNAAFVFSRMVACVKNLKSYLKQR